MSTFSTDIGGEEEDGAGWNGLAPTKAELRAEREQAALERDAARYRWIRANYDVSASRLGYNDLLAIRPPEKGLPSTTETMDLFIDAMRKKVGANAQGERRTE